MTRHAHSFVIDSLEPRRHLALDFAVLIGGTLTVTGTAGNDVADIIERKGKIRVHMNSTTEVMQFPRSLVTSAIVQMGAGNDHFIMGASLDLDVRIFGGDGNDILGAGIGDDRIEGGNGNDSLLGGGGNDRLYGNAGDDLLHGQAGRDYLYGNDGNDTAYLDSRDRLRNSIEILR